MTMTLDWVSRRYSSQDAEDCAQLLRRISEDNGPLAPAYRDWQCRPSPAGTPIAALAREAKTGRLLGQAVAVPIGVRLSGEVRTAGLCLSPMVEPACQDSEMLAALLRDVCVLSAEEGVAFSYGLPDGPSYSIFVNRADFRDVGPVPLLIRPLNPERLAVKSMLGPVLGKAVSTARKIWRTPRLAPPAERPPGLEIAQVGSFGGSFAVFWGRVHHRFPVMALRDPAYLNWRFANASTREYTIFEARSDGQIRGFAVLRVAPLGRFTAGLIAELLVEASAEGRAAGRLLIDQASAYFEEHDLDLVASLALRHTDEFRLLRSRGFWVCPRFLQPQPYRLVVRCHDEEASPSRLAYDLRNWLVTMADCEAV